MNDCRGCVGFGTPDGGTNFRDPPVCQSGASADRKRTLGKNPAEAKRLSSMNPAVQLVELGMILAKITAPAAPAPVSAAPKPITPIKAGTESPNKSADEMTMEEYASMRRQKEGWADPQRPKPNPRARH